MRPARGSKNLAGPQGIVVELAPKGSKAPEGLDGPDAFAQLILVAVDDAEKAGRIRLNVRGGPVFGVYDAEEDLRFIGALGSYR